MVYSRSVKKRIVPKLTTGPPAGHQQTQAVLAHYRRWRFFLNALIVFLAILASPAHAGSRQGAIPLLRDGMHLGDKAVQVTFGPVGEQGPAVSPDGKWLAFEYFGPNKVVEVWIMPIEGQFSSARPLVANGNRNANPTWSPDGMWISFVCETVKDHYATDDVCKANRETGKIVRLTHFPQGYPGGGIEGDVVQWLADQRIAFEYANGIYTIPPDGGPMTELLNVGAKIRLGGCNTCSNLYEARVSPDGALIAIVHSEPSNPGHLVLAVVNLKTSELRHPLKGIFARFPAWINNDWVLYTTVSKRTERVQIWALCLSTGRTEELTRGQSDIEPTFSFRLGTIFFPHSSKVDSLDSLYDYHIWRQSLPKSTIERWNTSH